MLGGRVKNQKY